MKIKKAFLVSMLVVSFTTFTTTVFAESTDSVKTELGVTFYDETSKQKDENKQSGEDIIYTEKPLGTKKTSSLLPSTGEKSMRLMEYLGLAFIGISYIVIKRRYQAFKA